MFETSNGPHPHGTRHAGHEQLAAAFPRIWDAFQDVRWEDATHVACRERGFSEWTFMGTSRAGKLVKMRGVDLFTFRDGKICPQGYVQEVAGRADVGFLSQFTPARTAPTS